MTGCSRMLSAVLVCAFLTSCGAEKVTKASCPSIGRRIHEQDLRGVIYGAVGAKAEVAACPGVRLPYAFVGEEPADYLRLKQLAEQRQDVLGFTGRADGYIVSDGPAEYVLLLITLNKVREDTSVAKRARAATR